MSKKTSKKEKELMPSVVTIEQKIREQVDAIIDFCTDEQGTENFFTLEQKLRVQIFQLGCLFLQLLLISLQEKFDYSTLLQGGLYYLGENVPRTIKTIYGEVRYWRNYRYPKSVVSIISVEFELRKIEWCRL